MSKYKKIFKGLKELGDFAQYRKIKNHAEILPKDFNMEDYELSSFKYKRLIIDECF